MHEGALALVRARQSSREDQLATFGIRRIFKAVRLQPDLKI
jgi:hypothetical protein